MRADVSLRPVTLSFCDVEPSGKEESTDVIAPVARDGVITESQLEIVNL